MRHDASVNPAGNARGDVGAGAAAAPVLQALAWMVLAGFALSSLNATMRAVTLQLDSMQAQFLRHLFSIAVMLPLVAPRVARSGLRAVMPADLRGQVWRGLVHTGAVTFFFLALPHLPLADVVALNFMSPIWVMIGAALALGERVSGTRWVAAITGFAGVLVVVWPHLGPRDGAGIWIASMLVSSPLFAASFLITKALTRRDSPAVIVLWQALTVSLFTLPLAILTWAWPTPAQWVLFAFVGALGVVAHYAFTRAFALANISALQSTRFLDLVWASVYGLLLFDDVPTPNALGGGVVIVGATIWIAQREARAGRAARTAGQAPEASLPATGGEGRSA